MTTKITTEWTLHEMATLRMTIADRLRDMRDDDMHYNAPQYQTLRGIQAKITLLHEDMVLDYSNEIIKKIDS